MSHQKILGFTVVVSKNSGKLSYHWDNIEISICEETTSFLVGHLREQDDR